MIYRRLVNNKVEETILDSVAFEKQYDVIVVGVGTAGAYAVISAASRGVSVLGIDRLSGAGGMGTEGYVSGYYYGAAGGLYTKMDEAAGNLAQEMFLNNVEPKKYLIEKAAIENHAELLFETTVTGTFLDGNTVLGISALSDGKQRNFSCRVLIDATADAEICRQAGCKIHLGRKSDGRTRPFTSVKVSLKSNGDITRTNHDSGYVNQYDPFELSDGILQAHASQLLEEFDNRNEQIIFFAPYIGIREGCTIDAEKTIRIQDAIAGLPEKEPLFYAYSDFDKHGKDHALETEDLQDWFVAANLSTACLSVPVTVRTLIPKGYSGILAAGRHIGLDHDVASIIRMKRDMQKCGESAGLCAALAVQKNIRLLSLPYEELKGLLEESGCLTENHNVGIAFDDAFRREKIVWMTRPEDIKAALSTDMPGVAIYSCKLLGSKIVPSLKGWMQEKDEMLSLNSAIALGLIGDKDSLPVLRKIVVDRDAFYFKDCRRTNQLRTAIALYLLGKAGDPDSIPILRDILCDPGEYKKDLYHAIKETSSKINTCKNFNEVYFQIVSQAAISLTKIVEKNPEVCPTGLKILAKAFMDNRHIKNTTSLPEKTFEYESMENIRNYVLDFCRKQEIQQVNKSL